MFITNVPKMLQKFTILTSAYLINRIQSHVFPLKHLSLNSKIVSPIRFLFDLSHKIYGCTTFVHNFSHNRNKLDPRALKCVFIRYSFTQKSYNYYNQSTKKVFISLDVTFFENNLISKNLIFMRENVSERHLFNFSLSFFENVPNTEPLIPRTYP